VAAVVPVDPAAPPALDDLRAFARGRLASHKLPDDVVALAELPLTAMQKIDRTALGAQVSGQKPGTSPGGVSR
jgi:fatty-acyl-CoA synthase